MKTTLLYIYIVPFFTMAQTVFKGIVLDESTKEPIEFVDVISNRNYTISNNDGQFEIEIDSNRIDFQMLGYEKISKKANHLKLSGDTILLKSKFVELDEVVVTNKTFPLGDYIKIGGNYPFESFSEAFFLRMLLKKNDTIQKLQDISGLIRRKQLLATEEKPKPKNNVEVQITNMRRAVRKEDEIYFEMWGFDQMDKMFSSIAMSPKLYDFGKNTSLDKNLTKLTFKAKSLQHNLSAYGHYVINSSDKAIQDFYLIDPNPADSYEENSDVKYRTIFFEMNINYKKDINDNQYYMDKAKINATVELFDKDNLKNEPIIYNASYIWFGLNRIDYTVKRNVSSSKDVFKLDFPYNDSFWKGQNILLLTDEMQSFLNSLPKLENRAKFKIGSK